LKPARRLWGSRLQFEGNKFSQVEQIEMNLPPKIGIQTFRLDCSDELSEIFNFSEQNLARM